MPMGLALLEQPGGDAPETATALTEWQKPLHGSNTVQPALHPPRYLLIPSGAAKIRRTHQIAVVLETVLLHSH